MQAAGSGRVKKIASQDNPDTAINLCLVRTHRDVRTDPVLRLRTERPCLAFGPLSLRHCAALITSLLFASQVVHQILNLRCQFGSSSPYIGVFRP